MGERRRRGEPAAAGPETRDLLPILREARDRSAFADDAVGVAHVRGDLLGGALDFDEEDGLTRGQVELGPPELERIDGALVQKLRGRRKNARLEEIVERSDRVLQRLVPSEDDGARRRPRLNAETKTGEDAERALRADEQLGEVDAARRLERLRVDATGRDDRAVREHDFRPEHVGRRRAPAHRVRSACVVRGHPAERAGPSAAGIWRKEQALIGQGVLEIEIDETRLDHRLQVAAIDLDDLPHSREGDDDPAFRRDGPAGLPGARAARHDRRLGLVRHMYSGNDLGRRLGHDDGARRALLPQRPERSVV